MLDSPNRYASRYRPDGGARTEMEGHADGLGRRSVHPGQGVHGAAQQAWAPEWANGSHADGPGHPEDGAELVAFPRVVSQSAPREQGPAPYYAAANPMRPPMPAYGPEMAPPPAGVDYGHDIVLGGSPAYGPPQRPLAPSAGAMPYPPQQHYAPPAPHNPPARQPSGDQRSAKSDAHRAQPQRQSRRAPAPAAARYRFGRVVAYAAMTIGWLLVVAGIASPALQLLGGAVAKLGIASGAILAGTLVGGGLMALLSAHALIALFDQAEAMRDLATMERAKWGEDARRDGA